MRSVFVDVILPFALEKNYTYVVPDEFVGVLSPGMRVEVPFRNKTYTGIVAKVHDISPQGYSPKPVLSLPDHLQVVNKTQLDLWTWISKYYMCSVGDVMNAALPAPYKLSSETVVVYNPQHGIDLLTLDEKEYLIAEALTLQQELRLIDVQQILRQKTVQPIIKALIAKGIAFIKEELKESYTVKTEKYIILTPQYRSEYALQQLFESLQKSEKQTNVLMIFYQLSAKEGKVKKSVLLRRSGVTAAVLKTMIKNDIFEEVEEQVSRLQAYGNADMHDAHLNVDQQKALSEIEEQFEEKQTVLLHGVTGSGKTEVYIELMLKTIAAGKQVLYLLPEIALTAQIVTRLKKRFGNLIGVYHSKFNQNERIEIWQHVLNNEFKVILGARSALFLPFNEIGLIIVDEEHDYSYKQHEPSPRYHARDTAIYLGHLHQAKVLLGTATPSVETYYQAKSGKFGLVEMFRRHGDMPMPTIQIVDMKAEEKQKTVQGHFSSVLVGNIKHALQLKEQVILFQNRRGYAPFMICQSCGWTPKCTQCDVNLVYHKYANELRCHYCNHVENTYSVCPACNSSQLIIKGFGTERIDDDLQYTFPEARTARLDLDAIKTKHGHEKLVRSFEEGEIDILTGTQMVTKGLDFDHVNLVGILSADQIINFSDFRAAERAFQMITQVSGRAGRKHKKGLVLIQAIKVDHPVLQYVITNDFHGFYEKEISERRQFGYPPFTRLIRITFRHSQKERVFATSDWFAAGVRASLGDRLLGPAVPGIPRIRNKYLMELMVKFPNNRQAGDMVKEIIKNQISVMMSDPVHKKVDFLLDVDPM
ncbi:MAG TPA: primosomal protein N' [Chitinophagales bacterium]|nr:primosomal protein N' [Chitinophagales bacterium]HNK96771.1 primosomal protein N' [Chitinophagales bacterium]